LFSSHLYFGIGPRILRSWPGFMSCICVLIGPFSYFLTNKSKVPFPVSFRKKRETGVAGEFLWRRLYRLIDVGDGSVGSDSGLLIGRTLVHGQKTRIDDETQRRILLWQFEREQFRIMIDISHFCQLHKKSATALRKEQIKAEFRVPVRDLEVDPFLRVCEGCFWGGGNGSFSPVLIEIPCCARDPSDCQWDGKTRSLPGRRGRRI
jgi:hypothetical protein